MFHSRIARAGETHFGRAAATAPAADRGPADRTQPPQLLGDFARAAYYGALDVSAHLAAASAPNPQLAILTDMYIHWQHDVAYKVADAHLVTSLDSDQIIILIARMCRQGVVRRYRKNAHEDGFHLQERIDLVPAYRADLSGYFARAHDEGLVRQAAENRSLNLS